MWEVLFQNTYNIKWIIYIRNSAMVWEHKKEEEKTNFFLDSHPHPTPHSPFPSNDTDSTEPPCYDPI